jgi:hypothetical protein
VWSAEERAEGLEYMHPKPSSHSGRIVDNPEVTLGPYLFGGQVVNALYIASDYQKLTYHCAADAAPSDLPHLLKL